jgi:hypothetical protein
MNMSIKLVKLVSRNVGIVRWEPSHTCGHEAVSVVEASEDGISTCHATPEQEASAPRNGPVFEDFAELGRFLRNELPALHHANRVACHLDGHAGGHRFEAK